MRIGYIIVAFILPVLAIIAVADTSDAQDSKPAAEEARPFSPYVDGSGNIQLPTDYKTGWNHLGDWAVGKMEGQLSTEFHGVYAQPGVIESYQETGEFPDGAVLVKEVRSTQNAVLNTGHATWAADMKHWFVMIKDKSNRFPGNSIWGDGWGWAFFDAKDPTKNTTTNYKVSCIGCHIPAKSTDWVYVQGYPALKAKR